MLLGGRGGTSYSSRAEEAALRSRRVVGGKMVDGLILMEVQVKDERLKLIERLGAPAVALGMPVEPTEVPFVDFDFAGAGRLCVEHLVGLGHRHIGLLASPPGTFEKALSYAHRLWRSVESTLNEAGLPFLGLPLETSTEGTQAALDALFEAEPALSALIVNGEGMIDLLMPELQRRGKERAGRPVRGGHRLERAHQAHCPASDSCERPGAGNGARGHRASGPRRTCQATARHPRCGRNGSAERVGAG